MKANELRIGNLVIEIDEDTNESIKSNVTCWDFEKARLRNNENEMPWLIPIPLTEEWLIDLGFETYGNGEYEHDNIPIFYIWFQNNKWIVSPNSEFAARPKIDYVHELQNLYFALTGEELTLKTENNESN